MAAPLPVYKDPKGGRKRRVDDLLSRMTLEEKVAQMTAIWEHKVDIFDKDSNSIRPKRPPNTLTVSAASPDPPISMGPVRREWRIGAIRVGR